MYENGRYFTMTENRSDNRSRTGDEFGDDAAAACGPCDGFDESGDASSAGSERNRRRMRPEERRQAIFDAALSVFAERGFGGASLADVAEEAGVTKGCLYHYFDSKEALLLGLMKDHSPSSTAALDFSPCENRRSAVAALVGRIWNHFQTPGQLELTTLAINELPKAPDLARALFEQKGCYKRRAMCEALRAAIGPDEMDDQELESVATVLPYLVMGAALGYRIFQSIDPNKPSVDVIEQTVTKILTDGV
jgi:AcrR family transcriptional regulator